MESHRLFVFGRTCYALGIVAFGVQYFGFRGFPAGLVPAPPWTPGAPATAFLLGFFLMLCGLWVLLGHRARPGAIAIGAICLGCVLLLYTSHFVEILKDGNVRTGAMEALGLGAAGWILAGAGRAREAADSPPSRHTRTLATVGRLLFAVSMLVFGEQHFQYASFVATLVPSWIPGHLFWTYLTGVVFVLAGLSFVLNRLVRASALILAAMLLGWVVVLHAPRIAAAPRNAGEWASGFVALALGGGALLLASAPGLGPSRRERA